MTAKMRRRQRLQRVTSTHYQLHKEHHRKHEVEEYASRLVLPFRILVWCGSCHCQTANLFDFFFLIFDHNTFANRTQKKREGNKSVRSCNAVSKTEKTDRRRRWDKPSTYTKTKKRGKTNNNRKSTQYSSLSGSGTRVDTAPLSVFSLSASAHFTTSCKPVCVRAAVMLVVADKVISLKKKESERRDIQRVGDSGR